MAQSSGRFVFVIVPIVIAIFTSTISFTSLQEANAVSSDMIVSNLSINNYAITQDSVIAVNSTLILSAKVTNTNSYAQPIVAVFEILDASDQTVLLKLRPNTVNPNGQHIAKIDWIPDGAGRYAVRVFVLNDLEKPEVLSKVESASFQVTSVQPASYYSTTTTGVKTGDEIPGSLLHGLKMHALDKINKDRIKFGLAPLQPSQNLAAQKLAEDILTTKQASHWMTNGEKPYMTYSKLGGSGAISQNIGFSGSLEYSQDCSSGRYFCDKIDPLMEIDLHEYDMMYQDGECCDNQKRDNILDPFHTHVSIGIAYDDYSFVIVQNFENNWIDSDRPVFVDRDTVRVAGNLPRGHVDSINIIYDSPSTLAAYEANKDKESYDWGALVAKVINPAVNASSLSSQPVAPSGQYGNNDAPRIVPAYKWIEEGQEIEIEFSLSDIKQGNRAGGVYTVIVMFEDEDGHIFPVTSYSIL